MVIEPSQRLYNQIMDRFEQELTTSRKMFDMDILNELFVDTGKHPHKQDSPWFESTFQ